MPDDVSMGPLADLRLPRVVIRAATITPAAASAPAIQALTIPTRLGGRLV